MNCPQCKQPVGADQFHIEPEWTPVRNVRGNADALTRHIYVACDHCGLYQLVQDHTSTIIAFERLTKPADIARAEKLIPARMMDRPAGV